MPTSVPAPSIAGSSSSLDPLGGSWSRVEPVHSVYDYKFTPGPTSPDVCSGATLCMTISSLLDLLHLMFVQVLLSV